jgi:hypothetical protein
MEAVCERNCLQALERVRSNKGGPGIDGMTVDALPVQEHWLRARLILEIGIDAVNAKRAGAGQGVKQVLFIAANGRVEVVHAVRQCAKNDANDVQAICEAASRPIMHRAAEINRAAGPADTTAHRNSRVGAKDPAAFAPGPDLSASAVGVRCGIEGTETIEGRVHIGSIERKDVRQVADLEAPSLAFNHNRHRDCPAQKTNRLGRRGETQLRYPVYPGSWRMRHMLCRFEQEAV